MAIKTITPSASRTGSQWAEPNLLGCVSNPFVGNAKCPGGAATPQVDQNKMRNCVGAWLAEATLVDRAVFLSKYAAMPLVVTVVLAGVAGWAFGRRKR